jgi:acyl-[acyl-carrier-protein]-phospholipid O-acyltransferase/long-chain-fatty-acid--[acyl-carrier-protein] ligase
MFVPGTIVGHGQIPRTGDVSRCEDAAHVSHAQTGSGSDSTSGDGLGSPGPTSPPSGSLLRSKSFLGLTLSQFLGAFNDNLFKQLILFLAARELFPGQDKQGIAFTMFALPFVLFSGVAGDLSERFSKRSIIVAMKVAEVGIMVAGIFAFQARSWGLLLAVLFLMGTHSAFFGPSKYGIIPELVEPRRLLSANGIIAMTTFLSILLGQALAGPLLDRFGDRLWIVGSVCSAFAATGVLCSLLIRRMPPTRPNSRVGLHPFGSLWKTLHELRGDRTIFAMVLTNSFFWFNGGVLQQTVTALWQPRHLDLGSKENALISRLLVTLAMSVMLGCLVAPRVGRRVSASRMVVTGALFMVCGQAALMLVGPVVGRHEGGYLLAHAALALTGFSGAFFVVPVQTYLQKAPPPGSKGKAFAVTNFMNFVFIFMAGAFYLVTSWLDLAPAMASALAGAALLAFLAFRREELRRLSLA